jgi:hypothetical protein
MPALVPTDHVAEVVWLGVTPDRSSALQSAPREVLRLSFAGPEGEDHAGLTRPSDSRVLAQYTRGTEIRNVRQLSILSEEDIAAIAATWAFPGFAPRCSGRPWCCAGYRTSRASRRHPACRTKQSGATLTVDMENRPCHLVSKEIEAHIRVSARRSNRRPRDGAA